MKIENPASLSNVKVQCVFKICIYSWEVSLKTLGKTFKILQVFFLQIQQTKNTENLHEKKANNQLIHNEALPVI